MTSKRPRVSVIVATRNEEAHIEQCLRTVLDGALPPDDLEIVVADGGSTDRTREIIAGIAREHPNVRLIDNPGRTAPAGFNRAIWASRGDAVCVLSAHCYVDPYYFEAALEALDRVDADVVGGPMATLPGGQGMQARLVQALTTTRFGVGGSFRTFVKEGPVDTVVFGVYRRAVFERIGLFDERLVRNQDNELNSRLRAGGRGCWMVPTMKSYYYNRAGLKQLFWQNFRNGMYGVLTWRINPASFMLRHAVPMLFVLFLILGGLLAVIHPVLTLAYTGLLCLYGLLAVAASVQQGIRYRTGLALLMPLMFLGLHVAYGIGAVFGLFRFGLRRVPGGGPARLDPLPDTPIA